jgi:signal transduction histidine kinase
VCAESVTNAAKHSGAEEVCVTASVRDGTLHLTVSDDGNGGATLSSEGTGLRGLGDRVEALGGTLTVTGGAGGSTVAATIPTG